MLTWIARAESMERGQRVVCLQVSLPASNEEASSMLLRMENIDLRVGQGETFLERMLPVVSASVEYISRGSIDNTDFNLPVDLHKAFTKRRRKRPASSLPSDSGTSLGRIAFKL